MTRTIRNGILLAGMTALLVIATAGIAQTPEAAGLFDRQPVRAAAGRESEHVKGGGPVWREDPGRVEEGTLGRLTPDQYMQSMEDLGLLRHLRERGEIHASKTIGNWQRVGPVGGFGSPARNGRIAGMQIVPDGSFFRVYAGSCQGGLWRTRTDLWARWTDIGSNLPNPSVRAFSVDPDDYGHIIVGTGDHRRYIGAGMFETFDDGVVWNAVPLPLPSTPDYFYRLLCLGDDPGTLQQRWVAVCSYGPIYSDDGGATWQRSTDAGGSLFGDPWTDLVVHPTDPSRLYAVACDPSGGGTSGVWQSTDYGETWSPIASNVLPPSEDWSRASLAISRSHPGTLVTLVTQGNVLEGVYKTTNGGNDWVDITNELIVPADDYSFGGNQIWHAQAVAIHPTAPDEIYVAGVGLAVSHNGGATWVIGESQNGVEVGHVDFTQLHFSPVAGDDLLWMCNDGGIYYHRLSTSTTYDALGGTTNGLACSEIDYMDVERTTVAIGLQDNGTLISVDSGLTWEFIESADGAEVEIYDAVAGDIFYNNGMWSGTPTWRTFRLRYGAGKEFTNNPSVYMPRLHYSPFTGEIFTFGPNELYSMTADGTLAWTERHRDWKPLPYRTRNMWSAWGRENAFWFTYWADVSGGLSGDEDLTYVYRDGTSFTQKHWPDFNPSHSAVLTVTPSREWPNEAWVGVDGWPGSAKIFHLLDGGDTKIDITGNLSPVEQVRAIAVMPFDSDVIWAGTDLGVFQTTDGGQTWNEYMDGLPMGRCSELHFVVDPTHVGYHHLVLAIDGRGVWKRRIDLPPIIYVDGRVAASGDGTIWGGPYRTLAEALAVAPAGAIIAMHMDSYAAPQTINDDVKLVTWQGTSWIH